MALEMETNFVAEPTKLIPAHTGGAEFLAASHFTVSNDPRITRGCQKSVFVHDYPPWAVDRPRPIPPLPPSDILGADFNHFKANIPESKRAYQEKRVSKEDTSGYHDRLTATSFKIGGDNRLHNYATTHTSDYPMKEADVYKHKPNRKPQESFIPQGDPDKAANPMSDYKDRYRAHDIAGMDKAEIRKFHSAPTMKGDNRQHHFDTTHNSTFKPWQLPKIAPIVQQYSSNVPQGDLVHGRTMATTFQVDYKPHEITKPHLASATAALQSTHIKQGNGNWNEFTSTMTDSYKPVSVPVVRSEKQNNVSFVPQGDDDPNRNAFRACMTTHRIDYVKQHAAKPKLVSGANRDTSSQVVFGDPQQGDRFFETTHNATYTNQQLPERKKTESDNYKSSVPVDYYKGAQDDTTTYRSNYLKYDQARLNLNPLAIARMRESHIRAANDGFHEYSTEYTDQYLEKMRQNRGLEFDKDRLQKSSVPLGTMNI